MHYDVKFPTKSIADKFRKKLEKVSPPDVQQKIMQKVEVLSSNPRPFGRNFSNISNLQSMYINMLQGTGYVCVVTGCYTILMMIEKLYGSTL